MTPGGQVPKEAALSRFPSRSPSMRALLLAATLLSSTALIVTAPAPAQVGIAVPQPVPMAEAMPPARDVPYPGTIRLDIDASDTSRGIYRVVETIPVRPGPLTLL